jgi:1-deoxy-D-xylulose-5-phosphate synthase
MAAGGLLPVVAIYSTFMQRAVDQVFHDVALQGLHVVFAVDRAGLVPDDGETHQGIYDLSMFRSLPGMSILAPASGVDLALCLRWAVEASGPVMVRYPKALLPAENPAFSLPVEPGRGVFLRRSGKSGLLVFAAGLLAASALEAALSLEAQGLEADVYALRFVAPLDAGHLSRIAGAYSSFLSIEENAGPGCVGESLAAIIAPGRKGVTFRMKALPSEPLPQGTREELLALSGLAPSDILHSMRECCLALRSVPDILLKIQEAEPGLREAKPRASDQASIAALRPPRAGAA